MSRQVWRVDAQHELDGALSYIWHSESTAHTFAKTLAGYGWECDVYQEVTDSSAEEADIVRLTARPWPVAPLAELLKLAGGRADAIQKAQADLAAIQERKQATR
jgi:hypothetical protein